MNTSKITLADVLTLLTGVSYGAFCFLSLNFFSLGNTNQSILIATFFTVLLIGTALCAKLLKVSRRNFKTSFIWENIFIFLFTFLIIGLSYFVFAHYFVVSKNKTEIQKELKKSISQAEDMFLEYEEYVENRKKIYQEKLESVVWSKHVDPISYKEYGFVETITDARQIDNKMFRLNARLFPSNYSDTLASNGIKEVAKLWLNDANRSITNWKAIGVVDVLKDVERNSKEWLDYLVGFSEIRELNEEDIENFTYSLSFDDTKKYFQNTGKPTILSIGITALTYILMLLSWFISKRSSKSQFGLRRMFLGVISKEQTETGGDFDIPY